MSNIKSNRHITKVCACCGKQSRGEWVRHFTRNHVDTHPSQWDGISALLGEPWCENWKEVIQDGAEPVNVRVELKGGRKSSKNPDPAQNYDHNNNQDSSLLIIQNIEVPGIVNNKVKARVGSENLLKKCVFNKIGGQNQKGGNQNNQINKNNGFSLDNQNKKRQKVNALEAQPLIHECDQALKCNIMQHQNIVSVTRNAREVPAQTLPEVIDEVIEERQNNVEITTIPAIDQQFPEIAVVGPQKVNTNIWDNCVNGLQQVQHINTGYQNTSIAANEQQIAAKNYTAPSLQLKEILTKSAQIDYKIHQTTVKQMKDTIDDYDTKFRDLQCEIISLRQNNTADKYRCMLGIQIDANKKICKQLSPNENISELDVSSLHSSQIVNFYRDSMFNDAESFQEGYLTAEDDNISKYKKRAYEDKVLVRNSQYWESKMQKLKGTQENLEKIIQHKATQIAELEHQLIELKSCVGGIQQEMQCQSDQNKQMIADLQTALDEQSLLLQRIRKRGKVIACSVTEASTNVAPFVIDAERQLLNVGYSQVQLIGQGGFGVVFKAWKDQKLFAIKIPIRLDCKNEIILMKKIQSTGFLNRQFVVPIVDEILIMKRPSFVMNYYEKTLVDFIQENHSIEQIKLIFYFILRGVSAAHTHSPVITHRDIKPANILLNSLMSPLIADWGLASQDSHQFTGGTCSYMDPRIWHQAKSTPQNLMQSHYGIKPQKSIIDYKSADVWSLGIVLYLMIEKKHPFTKDQIASWRDSSVDIKIPLNFTIADNNSQIFITSMLQLDQRKRPSVVQLLQNSVFAEITKGIEMFTDPIDLRPYFRKECVQSNMPQAPTTFTQNSEADPAQETTSYQNQIFSVCSISTLRHPSDIWHQEELNVQSILNAVNEDSLLKFFDQQNKTSALVKDIWKYFSRIVAGKVLDFIKVSDFIERIKTTKSLKLNLREYSYNRDQSLLTLCQEPKNTHVQQSLTQINSGILKIDLSLSIDSSDSSDDLIKIESSEFYNIRKETLTEFTQIQGIIARTVKYIQQIEHNEEFDTAINSKDTIINDKKHVVAVSSLPVAITGVVDMSLENEAIKIEPHENADLLSQSHISVFVCRNLCITKNKAQAVVNPTILGKRRERKHKQCLNTSIQKQEEAKLNESPSSCTNKKRGRQQLDQYKCVPCEKKFSNSKKLAKHKYQIHGKGRDLTVEYMKVYMRKVRKL